uniref:Proteasomal ubiquitin receptor ADRM1 homolog n=1 Tax=Parascaris univalens TaxID=6257 RepID=A0A915BKZ5_PARUN
MSVMFANTRPSQGSSGYLVEFKAGRSHLQAGSTAEKRKVVADKTKGTVFIKQSNDQLMHFCWKNRETGAVADDLIIFPGDTEFVRVKECTDGRVYMLKFKSTDERRLFWMQDGKSDKDEDYCKKVNDLLNNPPTPRAGARGSADRVGGSSFGGLAALGGTGADGELGPLSNLDQSQLMQLLSLMNHSNTGTGSDTASLLPQLSVASDAAQPAVDSGTASAQVATPSNTPANGTVAGGSSTNAVQLSQLKDIIASIAPSTAAHRRQAVDLADVLTGDNVIESVRNNEERLLPHIPNQEPIHTPQEELEQTVRAPQYRQAVDMFGHALQTGQLAPVLQQFGVTPEVATAAQSGDLVNFAQKLTDAENETHTESTSASQPPRNPQVDAEIAKEAAAEETNESAVREPQPKRGKPDEDDSMDLD